MTDINPIGNLPIGGQGATVPNPYRSDSLNHTTHHEIDCGAITDRIFEAWGQKDRGLITGSLQGFKDCGFIVGSHKYISTTRPLPVDYQLTDLPRASSSGYYKEDDFYKSLMRF